MSTKIHIYFMPGLAASSKIFEFIKLSNEYEIHYLEWIIPLNENEPLNAYAKRMCNFVTERDPILVGVSFGGILVQEMSKHISTKKVIIISSVKSNLELPKRLLFLKNSKAYKLAPVKSISQIEKFSFFAFGKFLKTRIKLYNKYLTVKNELYLKWAIKNVLHWNKTEINPEVIHIHGTNDFIFPHKKIANFIPIKNGTHIMIITKAKQISKILQDAI